MKVQQLKEKARRHEQREEWQKALDLYRDALRMHPRDEPADITLYNRVGDLQTRLRQIDGAVQMYERAIDLYLEAELPNNAIAICKKVLRNLPDRHVFLKRMGQIRASQGFLSDARQSFLTYAEKVTATGDLEAALGALIEFVDLSPEDVEIRLGLGSQLESHGRREEAVDQYSEAFRRLALMERDREAEAVADRLALLAPDLVLSDPESIRAEALALAALEPSRADDGMGGFGFWGAEEGDGAPETPASGLVEPAIPEPEIVEGVAAGRTDEAGPRGERESFVLGSHEEVLASAALEEAMEDEVEEEAEPLPLLASPEEEAGEEGAGPLPLLSFDEEEGVVPLPLLSLDGGEGPEEALQEALEEAAAEADAEVDVEAPAASVAGTGAPPPPTTHQEAAARGDLDLAMEMVRALIADQPDQADHHQRLVEYAFRKADQSVLVPAYMDLAGCLSRTGAALKARAVYQQVLALFPGHEGARAALAALEGVAPARPVAQVASSEEYVDLGAMILGEEATKTTRWKVSADVPSGDDQADFSKMLSQFKQKVAENVDADDVSAHHDLGTAYMEMGLLDEAISEFQMALRAKPDHLPTFEVLGRCWLELGKPDMAARTLNRVLRGKHEVEDELIGIYYHMGKAQEQLGNLSEAVEFFEKVFSLDINFLDVTERLRALR